VARFPVFATCLHNLEPLEGAVQRPIVAVSYRISRSTASGPGSAAALSLDSRFSSSIVASFSRKGGKPAQLAR